MEDIAASHGLKYCINFQYYFSFGLQNSLALAQAWRFNGQTLFKQEQRKNPMGGSSFYGNALE